MGLCIISKKSKTIKNALLSDLGTGVTVFKGVDSYGSTGKQEDMEVIQIILNRIDSKKAHRVIDSIDGDAFIVEFDVNHIKGGVLRKYLIKSKNKSIHKTIQ